FFERHHRLIRALIDLRFDEEPSRLGLETFLGASSEDGHWLLIADLDGDLLPFPRQRILSSDLKQHAPPGRHLLIIENETCLHLLPAMTNTIAILGAGFDLSWTSAHWLKEKRVGYWGDLDTWGLQFLAKARANIPHLTSLLTTLDVYQTNRSKAVQEPVIADHLPPSHLTTSETHLYEKLVASNHGRLEQEFIPGAEVERQLSDWLTENLDD
ncbi:MAG: DUF2220 domain-containing protein, partial [Verrucomicrobiota bacterium]